MISTSAAAAAPNKHNCRKSETNLKLTSELIWDVTKPGSVAWAPEESGVRKATKSCTYSYVCGSFDDGETETMVHGEEQAAAETKEKKPGGWMKGGMNVWMWGVHLRVESTFVRGKAHMGVVKFVWKWVLKEPCCTDYERVVIG